MALTKLTAGAFPIGSVLQTFSSPKLDAWDDDSTTFIDIPGTDQNNSNTNGWCVKITPSAASSKVLIIVNMTLTSSNGCGLRLMRNAVPIYLGNTDGNRATYSMLGLLGSGSNEIYNSGANHISFLDAPSLTTEITYRAQARTRDGSNNFYVGRSISDVNNDAASRMPSSITVMEIKG